MVLSNKDGKGKAFGCSSDRFTPQMPFAPGPGSYTAPVNALEGTRSKKGMGAFASKSSRFRRYQHLSTPGPGSYKSSSSLRPSGMTHVFQAGSLKTLSLAKKAIVPSPCEYNPRVLSKSASMTSTFRSITGRHDLASQKETHHPAPWQY
jgi:hypothetical protein